MIQEMLRHLRTKKTCIARLFIFGGVFVMMSATQAQIVIEDHTFIRYIEPNPAQVQRDTDRSDVMVAYSWRNVLGDIVENAQAQNLTFDDDESVVIEGPALVYPNPASVSRSGGVIQLGYRLSKAASVESRIYDIRGNQIYKSEYPENTVGGHRNYNRVEWDLAEMGLDSLPSSVYFFLLMHNGRVIGKGKFVLMP